MFISERGGGADAHLGGALGRAHAPGSLRALARCQVSEIQRWRLIAALIDCVERNGVDALSVGSVIARARVSRKTFYEHFKDREDCFRAAFEQTLVRPRELAVLAYEREPGWRQGIRAGLGQLLALMDEQRGLARLWLLDALAAGPRVQAARAQVLGDVALAVDRARLLKGARADAPAFTGEAVLGGVLAVLSARLARKQDAPLFELLGPLMSMIVLPYLGEGAARRELRQRAEPSPALEPPKPAPTDPLAGLNMRLTYRTVRVLMVIAEHPGASNRTIGEGAGVIDQGQISKLLARLERLELVENQGPGYMHGGPNAWRLTARGARLERATRSH
jgi:AcrR family transcriptional regulator